MVKNVLFIAMDDCFSYRKFRNSFGPSILTPNLDRIANLSTVFDKAYCEIAVCAPSRFATMSGQSAFRNGLFNNENSFSEGTLRPDQMWSFRLKNAGFHCTSAGKIYHGYGVYDREVTDVLYSVRPNGISWGPSGNFPYVEYPGSSGYGNRGFTGDVDHHFYDYKSAQDAINFLNSHPSDGAPFYREAGFHHPHTSYDGPEWAFELYDIDDIVEPDSWPENFDINAFAGAFFPSSNPGERDSETWKGNVRNYFAAISHVDKEIGRLWDALQASPHGDDTMVTIYSDHGYHIGDRGAWGKFTMWEQAALAPLIIHVPGANPSVRNEPVSFLDIGQTILDMVDLPQQNNSPGRSLRAHIEGGEIEPRWVPTFWYGSASATNGDYRIVMYQDGSSEFFDLQADPDAMTNLGRGHPAFANARDELLKACLLHGYKLIEQGATVPEGAAEWSGLAGDYDGDLDVQGSFSSIGAKTRWSNSPGFRRQMVAMNGSNTDIHALQGASYIRVMTRRAAEGNDYTLTLGHGDKQVFLTGAERGTVHLIGGNNYIKGASPMTVYGGDGNDTIVGDGYANYRDLVFGGAGDDDIRTWRGNDTIYGGPGNDYLYGERQDDVIFSGPGRDTIDGGAGHDILHMEDETIATGRTGNDRFVVYRTEKLMQITDLEANDILDLTDWASLGTLTLTQVGSNVEVTAGMERLVCHNTTPAVVMAAAFPETITFEVAA